MVRSGVVNSPSTDAWGIDRRWVDAHGVGQMVADPTAEAMRSAIGRPPADLEDSAPLVLRPGAALDALVGVAGPVEVLCEDGSIRQIQGAVPLDFPLGYHRLRTPDGRDRMLVVSPGRCWLPQGWRAWGWTVQLYAVRSASSWGIGDLGDLRSIRDWAQQAGAGFLLINPLHAVAPTHPQEASPYLPASRRFRNPIYLAVEDVPGAELVDLTAARASGRALTELPLIDRDSVWRVKRRALWEIFQASADEAEFDSWRGQQGKPLEEFATWCALADEFGPDFGDWPIGLQRPDSPAGARFGVSHAAEIGFHAWLQWALEGQIRSATVGMMVLQDLPIGVDGGGADAWGWQDQLADGVRIGAPPDQFNSRGQNWGSPPFIPWRMRAGEYGAFIAAIRATMAATGGLRIDHVMGLFRLWWLPADGSPADGAYVRYPSADLLNLVALESHRAQAVVVGEDLGTVEPGVRQALAEHRILSYKLLWFEAEDPSSWPTLSMAAVTTHDLPTVAGLWSGADLDEQLSCDSGAVDVLVDGAAELRTRLGPAGLAQDAAPQEAVQAAYQLLAGSPATLLSATLEDAVADQRRPNMPGVSTRPNWSLPLSVRIEGLPAHPVAERIAHTLNTAIGSSPRGGSGGVSEP